MKRLKQFAVSPNKSPFCKIVVEKFWDEYDKWQNSLDIKERDSVPKFIYFLLKDK